MSFSFVALCVQYAVIAVEILLTLVPDLGRDNHKRQQKLKGEQIPLWPIAQRQYNESDVVYCDDDQNSTAPINPQDDASFPGFVTLQWMTGYVELRRILACNKFK